MQAYRVIDGDVLGRDGIGLAPRGVGALALGEARDGGTNAVQRPSQIDCRGTGRVECRVRLRERCIGGIAVEGQRQAVRTHGADKRGAAHPHRADREPRRLGIGDPRRDDGVRQRTLVEHVDVASALRSDERAVTRWI